MERQYSEQDLNFLIEEHLSNCGDYSHVCHLMQTAEGKKRIVARIKEIIFSEGVKNIHGSAIIAAIATIESELTFSESE